MRRTSLATLVALLLAGVGASVSAQQTFQPAQLTFAEIPFDSVPNFLKLPANLHLGEVPGVATNSKGHVFVYTRTGTTTAALGGSRVIAHGGSRLFEFDQNGTYVRELGVGIYGFMFAHVVRIDPQDNIWVVDEMASAIMKFDPNGKVLMVLGRKPEALNIESYEPPEPPPAAAGRAGGAGGGGGRGGAAAAPPPPQGVGIPGDTFNRPTDVAWDAQGNIFISDGYGNSRVAKFDKNGVYIKAWGSRGGGIGQFNTPHSIATDAQGNVYVGDRGNSRIQVFDNNGNFKTQFLHVGAPWAVCITPGPHQYLYSSNSNGTGNFDNGEIYKMELDGKVIGKFGTAGKQMKEFGSIHEIDCRTDNQILVGELTNWRVQKLMLRPVGSTSTK
jgi:streptogramin lyase